MKRPLHCRQHMPRRPMRRAIATDTTHQPARKETKSGEWASPGPGDMCAFLGLMSFYYVHLPFQKYTIFWFSCPVCELQHFTDPRLQPGKCYYKHCYILFLCFLLAPVNMLVDQHLLFLSIYVISITYPSLQCYRLILLRHMPSGFQCFLIYNCGQ